MILYYACNFLAIPSFILLSDIIFSTAHKAKGLEFDTVRVTDDYLPGTDLGMSIREYILWSNISRIIWFVEQEYEWFKWLTNTVAWIDFPSRETVFKLIYKHVKVLWKTREGLIQVICKHRKEIYQTRGVLHWIYKHSEKRVQNTRCNRVLNCLESLLRHAWRVKFCVTVTVFVCSWLSF